MLTIRDKVINSDELPMINWRYRRSLKMVGVCVVLWAFYVCIWTVNNNYYLMCHRW